MKMGALYIVATPIGHLSDITLRALEVLKSVDLIAAEDTRHSKILLSHYQIPTKMIALHEHNEVALIDQIIKRLQSGQSIALISDAGTPLISDPGYVLVRAAHAAGVPVSPIPGACAAIAALSASGLPSDRFVFVGFLPVKQAARQAKLKTLRQETGTLVFYESPRRVLALFEDLLTVFGPDRQAVVARELTKHFETIHGDSLGACIDWLNADSNQQKGELVVLVSGALDDLFDEMNAKEVLALLLAHMSVKDAAGVAAKLTGYKKNVLYDLALSL